MVATADALLPEPARCECPVNRTVKRWIWPQIAVLCASLLLQAVHGAVANELSRGIRLTLFFTYILLSLLFCSWFFMTSVRRNVRWRIVRPFFGQGRVLYLTLLVAVFFLATSARCQSDCHGFWSPVTITLGIGRFAGFLCFMLAIGVDCLFHRPPRKAVITLYLLHMAFCTAEFVLATTGVFEEHTLISLSGSADIGFNKLLSIVTSQFLILLVKGLTNAWSDRAQRHYYLVDNIDPVPLTATPKTHLSSLAAAARVKLGGSSRAPSPSFELAECKCPSCATEIDVLDRL